MIANQLDKQNIFYLRMSDPNHVEVENLSEGFQNSQQGYGDQQFQNEQHHDIQATAYFTHSQMNRISNNQYVGGEQANFNSNSQNINYNSNQANQRLNQSGSSKSSSQKSGGFDNYNQDMIKYDNYSNNQNLQNGNFVKQTYVSMQYNSNQPQQYARQSFDNQSQQHKSLQNSNKRSNQSQGQNFARIQSQQERRLNINQQSQTNQNTQLNQSGSANQGFKGKSSPQSNQNQSASASLNASVNRNLDNINNSQERNRIGTSNFQSNQNINASGNRSGTQTQTQNQEIQINNAYLFSRSQPLQIGQIKTQKITKAHTLGQQAQNILNVQNLNSPTSSGWNSNTIMFNSNNLSSSIQSGGMVNQQYNRYFPGSVVTQSNKFINPAQSIQPSILVNTSKNNNSSKQIIIPSNQQTNVRSANQSFTIQNSNRLVQQLPPQISTTTTQINTTTTQTTKPLTPLVNTFKPLSPPIQVFKPQSPPVPPVPPIPSNPPVQSLKPVSPLYYPVISSNSQINSNKIIQEIESNKRIRSPIVRQSMMFRNQVSQIIPGRRIQVARSSNSRGKVPVHFTYAQGVIPVVAPPVHHIQQHHTHTIIQRTTTVVWQQRYLTVIQRFNFVYQRFESILRQIATITELLQQNKGKQHLQSIYNDLLLRHSLLLEILSETQQELESFRSQNNQYKKEAQNNNSNVNNKEDCSVYKRRIQQLQKQNRGLKSQTQRLTILLNQTQNKVNKLTSQLQTQSQTKIIQSSQNIQTQITTTNKKQLADLQTRFKQLQQELFKSHTFNNQLQEYINKLESDNNFMAQQIDKYRNNDNQYVKLIKNQQGIIQELENRVRQMRKVNEGDSVVVKQYTEVISRLEMQVKMLQQKSRHPVVNQNQKNYAQIIQNQKQMIKNFELHFQQMEKSSSEREIQFKNILRNQESVIGNLEAKLRQMKGSSNNTAVVQAGISRDRERQLLSQIQQFKLTIQKLQYELDKYNDKINVFQQEVSRKNQQIYTLKQQRVSSQASLQQKILQRLSIIERSRQQKIESPQRQSTQIDNSREIQQLVQQNERLTVELRKKQQQKRKVQQQMISIDENMRRKIMERESQVRLLNDKIGMFQQQLKRKISEKDRRIRSLEQQIETLNLRIKSNVSTPRNQPNQQSFESYSPGNNNQQVRSLRQKLSNKQQEALQLQRLKQNCQKRYQNLQINFNSLQEQSSKKGQQILNLKRLLSGTSNYESQIKNLSETLNKKNQQILQLKSISYSMNEMKVELQATKNQRNNLRNQIQVKNQQIDKLRQTYSELQAKIRQNKQRQTMYPNTNQSALEELQIMYETVKRKEAQMTKLKQTNQLLETNVQQLQYQLERAKGKIAGLQKNLGHEKDEANLRQKQLENRIKQLQLKTKSLDESQRNTKSNFDIQLQNLDNLIKQKQDIIRKLQGENKILKNKLKNHDSKIQQYDSEIQSLNRKIKQLQQARDEMKKHIETLQSGGQNNNKRLYDQYQIKIVQLQAALKVKDNKVKQLQNTIETLKIKASHNNQTQDQFINQQQIQVLRKKIAQYQSRMSYQGGSKFNNYKFRDYESTHVFEQKAIYDLKTQNERLKSILSGKGYKYEGADNSKVNYQFVQRRLLDFNQKLQQLIEENKTLEQRNTDFSLFLQPKRSNKQLLNSFQRERTAIIRKHRLQIGALQARMVDLQRYCSSLQSFQSTSVYNVTNTKYNVNDSTKNIYAQQLAYYKEKNKELQDRIDNHIRLNKQLKQKLQSMMKAGADQNAIEFYKNQVNQLEKQLADALSKIKILTEQNKGLQKHLQGHRNDNSSQLRLHELESKNHELNRKISQLQMQNSILEGDISKYTQQLKIHVDQNFKLKSMLQQKDQKINSIQQNYRQLNTKISNYQMQIVKLNNQVKLLEAEIQRLNEKLEGRQGEQNLQVSRLKSKLVQLQADYRQLQQLSVGWNEAKSTYELTISALNNRIANLQLQMSRLNTVYENLIKKARDTQNQFYAAQNALKSERNRAAQLEMLLKRKQADFNGLNEYLERIKRQKESEGKQNRQKLAYISEMEQTIRILRQQNGQSRNQLQRMRIQVNEYRQKLSSMSSMQQIIKQLRLEVQLHKGQIQRLKSTNDQLKLKIAGYGQMQMTIEQLNAQISRLKFSNEQYRQQTKLKYSEYERIIEQLRIQNSRHKTQIQRLKKDSQASAQNQTYILELQQTIKMLRIEIQTYKAENNKSKVEIQRLRVQILRLQEQINKLRIHINDIQDEMRRNQKNYENITYRLEYLRSTYFELQALYGEVLIDSADQRQLYVKSSIMQSIAGGLSICSQTFALL